MKPNISVVLPTYNRYPILKHAIHSILDQLYQEWELIIVDDGSTDKTSELVKSFVDPRIKYHKLKHSGKIGKVRNFGNKKAKGELIVVQDSDDASMPDRLIVLWTEYQKTKADVLYHGMYTLLRVDDIITRRYAPAQTFNVEKLIRHQYIPGQVAYTKKAALKVPYEETMKTMDDWQILLEMALQGMKFHPIDRSLYEYWYTPDSVTQSSVKSGQRMKDVDTLMKILRTKYKLDIVKAEPTTGKLHA